jgi:transposase
MLPPIQKEILEKLIRASTTPNAVLNRAKIILYASENHSTYYIVKHLKVSWPTVQKWLIRWSEHQSAFEKNEVKANLKNLIIECLSDAPRSGRSAKFTPEQVVKIISLACTSPDTHGIPLSHWTSRALALQAEKMKIVEKISNSKVAILLKQGDLKPHRSQYWLNSRLRNSDSDFDERIQKICTIYHTAQELNEKKIHVISTDEKSGIQAIQRANCNLPMQAGSPEKIEHEYIRHGTQCLIANFEVATGKIIAPMISDTREEEDFLKNIQNVVATDPQGEWLFILDQLNTHKSVSMVKWVAGEIGFTEDLGIPRKRGILTSMETRMKFLEDKSHRIRFQYTPKHCSWMNQIEIWFSGISKRYLKRSSFNSVLDLEKGILDYITYANEIATPYKWTYKGKVLQA